MAFKLPCNILERSLLTRSRFFQNLRFPIHSVLFFNICGNQIVIKIVFCSMMLASYHILANFHMWSWKWILHFGIAFSILFTEMIIIINQAVNNLLLSHPDVYWESYNKRCYCVFLQVLLRFLLFPKVLFTYVDLLL